MPRRICVLIATLSVGAAMTPGLIESLGEGESDIDDYESGGDFDYEDLERSGFFDDNPRIDAHSSKSGIIKRIDLIDELDWDAANALRDDLWGTMKTYPLIDADAELNGSPVTTLDTGSEDSPVATRPNSELHEAMGFILRNPSDSLAGILGSIRDSVMRETMAEPIERILTLRLFPETYMDTMIQMLRDDPGVRTDAIQKAIYDKHGKATDFWIQLWRDQCPRSPRTCNKSTVDIPIGDGRMIKCYQFSNRVWEDILVKNKNEIINSGGVLLELWTKQKPTKRKMSANSSFRKKGRLAVDPPQEPPQPSEYSPHNTRSMQTRASSKMN